MINSDDLNSHAVILFAGRRSKRLQARIIRLKATANPLGIIYYGVYKPAANTWNNPILAESLGEGILTRFHSRCRFQYFCC